MAQFNASFINRKGEIDNSATHFYHFEDGTICKVGYEMIVSVEIKVQEEFMSDRKYRQYIQNAFCGCWFRETKKCCCRSFEGFGTDRKLYKIVVKNINKAKYESWEPWFSSHFRRGDVLLLEKLNSIRLSGCVEIIDVFKDIIYLFKSGLTFDVIRKKMMKKHLLLLPDNFDTIFGNMFSKKDVHIQRWSDVYIATWGEESFTASLNR